MTGFKVILWSLVVGLGFYVGMVKFHVINGPALESTENYLLFGFIALLVIAALTTFSGSGGGRGRV